MSTTASTADHFAYQYSHSQSKRSFGDKLRDMFCCGSADFDEEGEGSLRSVKLHISHPTDFRREEINIPGMSPSQERFVREKALADAKKMFENLQPLRSSPSSQFATRPIQQPPQQRISYEQFTQPRPSPKIPSHHGQAWDSLKAHGRKFSDSLKKPLQISEERRPSHVAREEDSAVEMRGLVKGDSQSQMVATPVVAGKRSEESWESESAKAGVEVGRI